METDKSKEDFKKEALKKNAWEHLDGLAVEVKKISEESGPRSYENLIDEMVTAIRQRNINALKKIAEDPEQPYATNIRLALEDIL